MSLQTRQDRVRACITLVLIGILALPRDAYAYIDPGTGSLAYQVALSVLLGVAYTARQVIARSFATCRRLFKKPKPNQSIDA